MASLSGRLAALTLAASFAAPIGASAETLDLFAPATPSEAMSAAASVAPRVSRATVRQRMVKIDLDALKLDGAASAASAAGGDKVRIALFPGTAATFTPKGVETTFGGARVWRGETDDGDAATLVTLKGKAAGRVSLKGRTYRITPMGGKAHRIAEVERGLLPPPGPSDKAPRMTEAPIKLAPAAPGASKPKATVVTVLSAYTEATGHASQNILLDSLMSIELANDAYKASKVYIKLKPVGLIKVENYDESVVGYEQILRDLTSESAAFDKTRAERDKKGADLVVLFREGGEYCGVGWIGGMGGEEQNLWSPDQGFSEVTRECIEFDVVAHEIGHNMGLNHDRYVMKTPSADAYNYGFVDVKQGYMDVMAYPDRCRAKEMKCRGINVFSNPQIRYNKRPFGVPEGGKGPADNARALNENREIVASFRPDVPIHASAAAE